MVTVTIVVSAVTEPIWFAIRSVVFAPEHATNANEVPVRCWATSHG
jgi:hypothetical protein